MSNRSSGSEQHSHRSLTSAFFGAAEQRRGCIGTSLAIAESAPTQQGHRRPAPPPLNCASAPTADCLRHRHHQLSFLLLLPISPARERCETAVLSAGLCRFCACVHNLLLPISADSRQRAGVSKVLKAVCRRAGCSAGDTLPTSVGSAPTSWPTEGQHCPR